MNQEITIGKHRMGPQQPPYIVAELSGNHNHSLERALKIIDAAKEAGVHAIKLQTYTPDTITLNIREGDFLIDDQKSLWKNRTLYDLYQEAHLPWEWHRPLFDRCKTLGLDVFSTPFDETAVDFLEELDVPCYKIASPEIVDLPLIKKVAKTGKPLIISTGAATLVEIAEAVETAKQAGCKEMILLKCTASYPANPFDANIRTIPHLAECFGTLVGLSDHSLGIGVAVASIALGACFIEKHFTISRAQGGVDSAFSMEPGEMRSLVLEAERAWQALGSVRYEPLDAEKVTRSHRPSLFFIENLPAGTVLTSRHLRSVRPGSGLPPKEEGRILGLKIERAVKQGTPVTWDIFHAH